MACMRNLLCAHSLLLSYTHSPPHHPHCPPIHQQKLTLLQSQLSQQLKRADAADRHRTSLEHENAVLVKQLADAGAGGGTGAGSGVGMQHEQKIATLQVKLTLHMFTDIDRCALAVA